MSKGDKVNNHQRKGEQLIRRPTYPPQVVSESPEPIVQRFIHPFSGDFDGVGCKYNLRPKSRQLADPCFQPADILSEGRIRENI